MSRLVYAVFAVCLLAAPAAADEFTDVIEGALEAYESGDISLAQEELSYAASLLGELKSASLSGFLPDALPGWTREDADAEGAGMAMAMFGGGTTASANYRKDGTQFTITLVANSPMVSSMGAMITGLAGGKRLRIQRTQFSNDNGEMQGVVDSRVLISVDGDAPDEDKIAHLETMDFRALRDF